MARRQQTFTAALLCSIAVLGGCARSVVITNTSNRDVTLTRSTPGGELSYTIRPGARLVLPADTTIDLEKILIEYR